MNHNPHCRGGRLQSAAKSVLASLQFPLELSLFVQWTTFSRAKTAVAVGTLSFLGAFFPYYTVNDEGVPMILNVIASLLSPTAFALGSINFADYECAHVGLRWSNVWLVPLCFGVLILCTV